MNIKSNSKTPVMYALLAAAFYGASSPLLKLLLKELSPVFLAAFLYIGAGLGMFTISSLSKIKDKEHSEAKITKKDIPYISGMILLDIAASIALMFGLTLTTPANASLLNNFEIAATAIVAMLIFKEYINKRMWISIVIITVSCLILSFEDANSLYFSSGSILVIVACICWGFENNCTRMLSFKNPIQIVVIKGLGSGLGALFIAVAAEKISLNMVYVVFALLLGFFAYGLSIYFYIKAQRELGAARTSAYYALAPFIGAGLSFIIYKQPITALFVIALIIMAVGTYFAAPEKTHA